MVPGLDASGVTARVMPRRPSVKAPHGIGDVPAKFLTLLTNGRRDACPSDHAFGRAFGPDRLIDHTEAKLSSPARSARRCAGLDDTLSYKPDPGFLLFVLSKNHPDSTELLDAIWKAVSRCPDEHVVLRDLEAAREHLDELRSEGSLDRHEVDAELRIEVVDDV